MNFYTNLCIFLELLFIYDIMDSTLKINSVNINAVRRTQHGKIQKRN